MAAYTQRFWPATRSLPLTLWQAVECHLAQARSALSASTASETCSAEPLPEPGPEPDPGPGPEPGPEEEKESKKRGGCGDKSRRQEEEGKGLRTSGCPG